MLPAGFHVLSEEDADDVVKDTEIEELWNDCWVIVYTAIQHKLQHSILLEAHTTFHLARITHSIASS